MNRLLLAYAAVYLGWGSTYLAIRIALETMPPFAIGASRFLVAGLAMVAWALARGASIPTLGECANASFVGFLLFLVGNGAVIWVEQTLSSGVTALLVASLPVFVTLLQTMKTKERPSQATLLGILGGLVGVVLLVRSQGDTGKFPLLEGLAILLGSLAWAYGSMYAKSSRMPKSATLSIGLQMLTGGAWMAIAGVAAGEKYDLTLFSARSILATGYLTVVGSLVAFSAYVWLFKTVSPERASTYAYVNPVVAVALGCWLGGESLSPGGLISGVVILGSVLLILSPKFLFQRGTTFGLGSRKPSEGSPKMT